MLESVEGVDIRSWEVILTYGNTLHSYRARTNVTISFCISADDEHIAPSCHRDRLSGHAAKNAALPRAYLADCARITTSHARIPFGNGAHEPLEVWPFCHRHSPHTAIAQNRRSEAPARPMLALLATARSTAMISIMPAH